MVEFDSAFEILKALESRGVRSISNDELATLTYYFKNSEKK